MNNKNENNGQVKVAVRVRPLNSKEISEKADFCIECENLEKKVSFKLLFKTRLNLKY